MKGDREDSRQGASASTGRAGEEVAARYLARRGCTILDRNWRANPGEVDIIAECEIPGNALQGEGTGKILLFVEVRTRHGRQGLAEESVSWRKASSMASAAYAYMSAHNLDAELTPWRIDLVAVAMSGPEITSINWIQGAVGEEMIEP